MLHMQSTNGTLCHIDSVSTFETSFVYDELNLDKDFQHFRFPGEGIVRFFFLILCNFDYRLGFEKKKLNKHSMNYNRKRADWMWAGYWKHITFIESYIIEF